jgi:hypothetical protein
LNTPINLTTAGTTHWVTWGDRRRNGLERGRKGRGRTAHQPHTGTPPAGSNVVLIGISALATTGLAVNFTWGASAGAGSYQLEAGSAAGLANLFVGDNRARAEQRVRSHDRPMAAGASSAFAFCLLAFCLPERN